MKRFAIITCVYNNRKLVEKVLEKVSTSTAGDFLHVIVYNHPMENSLDIIEKFKNKHNILVVDPGKNVGCTKGLNLGFEEAMKLGYDYLVKVDDDTIVPDRKSWAQAMMEVLESNKDICFVTPDSNVKQGGNTYTRHIKSSVYTGNLNIYMQGILGWTCMMMPSTIMKELGSLVGRHSTVSGKIAEPALYGGEEAYYCTLARQKGYSYGWLEGITAFHMDNQERDTDYVLWKYCYGYLGMTKLGFEEFKKSEDLIKGYQYWLQTSNQWYIDRANEFFKKEK